MSALSDGFEKTAAYIKNSWQKAVINKSNAELPDLYVASFVPPCVNGAFKALFYWDTFFTNRGLITDGFTGFAKNNVDNLIFALNKFGFVPNALSVSGTRWCSQPPFLHFMVRDVYEITLDEKWLNCAYFALKREYSFWQTERMTETGLNRYFHLPLDKDSLSGYYDYVAGRLKLSTDLSEEDKVRLAENYIAVAESGLDFSPRFCDFGGNIIPVDLNANLYGLEKDLFEWSRKFEPQATRDYEKSLNLRKTLMDKYLLGEDGLYHDYDFITGKKSDACFSGQFMPYITGVSRDKNALERLLTVLEREYGVISTEEYKNTRTTYQWAYPNTWAPDNYLCAWALEKNGFFLEAERIARKYMDNISSVYENTGRLWEKYDGVKGGISETNEYPMTEMLGWTGGVFSCFFETYKKHL